ncbi:hypothetical protein IHE44_0008928 [Lamprotornis superbus]|uniref:Ankyrin repeat domain-containing protein 9 n=1 Tax=Lamprotornis superbus TaxID=245042 RepID=A0A835TV76_9PASS|nr:hypothetical protein IHE44_0008928 [Lamprotornis superbus]
MVGPDIKPSKSGAHWPVSAKFDHGTMCTSLCREAGGLMQEKAGLTQLFNWEKPEPTGPEGQLGLSAHAWLWVHHSCAQPHRLGKTLATSASNCARSEAEGCIKHKSALHKYEVFTAPVSYTGANRGHHGLDVTAEVLRSGSTGCSVGGCRPNGMAVRDHKPVWMLEDMRTMEYFYWEENASLRTYSPSEALLYAVVHNHLPYAQYLLSHFPEEALKVPGEHFCYCPSSAPHLAMAVTYDRRDILGLIIKIAHKLPSLNSYINRAGCFHLEDGKTPLHLACELLRSETVLILLGNGASPRIEDSKGLTPLDVILEQMWDSKVNVASKKLCLDYLLLFMPNPQFKMRKVLQEHPDHWTALLGEDKFNSLVRTEILILEITNVATDWALQAG